ncbi:60S ribosomal protein L29 [Ceratobasidium sp. UAMH 11750]|nr:60S ribosomal protein L29 [Ceratobasidium sp. UAMH 11750]
MLHLCTTTADKLRTSGGCGACQYQLASGWSEAISHSERTDVNNPSPSGSMAKSKNHTNHNQNKKAHRNGIKKPKTHFAGSMKGVDAKFRRNQKFARLGTQKAIAAKKAEA